MPPSALNPDPRSSTAPVTPPIRRRGRPVVLDEAKRHEFCNLLRLGCTISEAARLVGISRRGILYAARREPDLAERIRLARQESRLDPINKITNSKSWQAAAWLLERNSRHWRLPPKPSAARQAEKLFHNKRLRRTIRGMVERLLDDTSQFARNEK